MKCCFLNSPADNRRTPIREDRRKMHHIWKQKSLFESSEQKLCNHARVIMKNEWLSVVEIKMIKKRLPEISCNEGVKK